MSNDVVVRPILPTDIESAWRLSTAFAKSGLAPKGIQTTEAIFTAIQMGAEVGLTPMQALQNIAVVNGRPTIWGDAQLGLVRGSKLLESFEERIEGEGESRTAICIVKRKGDPAPITSKFSVDDAKRAGLWGKPGPWQQYPDRMLKMRARGFALRDGFSDILKGVYSREEMEGVEPIDITPAEKPLSASAQAVNEALRGTSISDTGNELSDVSGEGASFSPAAAGTESGEEEEQAGASLSLSEMKRDTIAQRVLVGKEILRRIHAGENKGTLLEEVGGAAFLAQLGRDGKGMLRAQILEA